MLKCPALNGHPLLVDFDVVADAGSAAVDVRVFKDVYPASDGKLHLEFLSSWGRPAFVSALELTPGTPGELRSRKVMIYGVPRPTLSTAMLSGIEVLPASAGKAKPVRIRAGWTSPWQDSAGQVWQVDSYFLGGNALVRTTNPAQGSSSIAPDMALFASERWGHFSYAVPVAAGRYRVTLKFCEGHYGERNTGTAAR